MVRALVPAGSIVAILDTCVLIPSRLRDLLLEIAAIGMYESRWSEETLEELHRTVIRMHVERGADHAAIAERISALIANLKKEFPEATVP